MPFALAIARRATSRGALRIATIWRRALPRSPLFIIETVCRISQRGIREGASGIFELYSRILKIREKYSKIRCIPRASVRRRETP